MFLLQSNRDEAEMRSLHLPAGGRVEIQLHDVAAARHLSGFVIHTEIVEDSRAA